LQLLEFAAMLHLWRNPPEDGDDWIGFTSYRQLDKSSVVFAVGDVEAELARADVLAWLQGTFSVSLTVQAEMYHPGIRGFLGRLFADLQLGDAGEFDVRKTGIFASYWAVRKSDFAAYMAWFAPAICYCLERLAIDPYLRSHPKSASYALERLFMVWCWRTNKRVRSLTHFSDGGTGGKIGDGAKTDR
jgi:hypothetical protein